MISPRSPGRQSRLATPTASSATNDAAFTVTEASFEAAFKEPIILQFNRVISSGHDVSNEMQNIYCQMVHDKNDWEERTNGLKRLRKCVQELIPQRYTDAFFTDLNGMSEGLRACVDDARFLVMHEACITIAFIARETQTVCESSSGNDARTREVPRFACIAVDIVPVLIRSLAKNVKRVTSCAAVTLTYIIKFTKTPKLIRVVCALLAGTSDVAVRKSCYMFIARTLKVWDRCEIGGDKYVIMLENAVLRGLNDSDGEVRKVARKAFVEYHGLFPEEALVVLGHVYVEQQNVKSLIKNSMYGTLLAPPATSAHHQLASAAVDAEHANENIVVSGSNEVRTAAAVSPILLSKPYFSTGSSITMPKAVGGRPPSAFEQPASSSGGGGDGEKLHAAGNDADYSASFVLNNGIAGSSSVSDFRPSALANNSNAPRSSPQNVTPISHAADVNSGHEDEVKNLQNQLAKAEAENRKLKDDEAARKAAAPKMRYTMVYDKHQELVFFQLLQCKNLPLVSLKGDAVYHPADAGFNGDDNVEPSASAVVKLVNTSTDAVVPPLAAPKAQDEDANHLRVSRAEKAAGSAARPRRSSSFSNFLSHLKRGGDDDFERKTKIIKKNSETIVKKNMNPYFAETFSIPMLPSTLAEGKCVLCVEIVHVRAKLLGRDKKLTLGKARVVLNAESVVSTEMSTVEHECELF